MAKISNFRINTHYTALKQLPHTYKASFNISGTYGYGIGIALGSATITVPSDIYVETPLLRFSLDGGLNHLSSEIAFILDTYATVYISLDHISGSQYRLVATLNNTSNTSVTVPSGSVEAKLALATAPF